MNLTTEADRKMEISQLAKAAKVCGLSNRDSLPEAVRAVVAKADTSKRFLNTEELEEICKYCKTSEHAIGLLIAESNQVIDKARQQLLAQQPQLILPGGKLHPEPRAEACWRDCQQFLRVIIYGVACDCTEVTDAAGMRALRQLYKEMEVPIPAMMYILAQMRTLTTQVLEASGHLRETTCLDKAFDNLIKALLPTMPRQEDK
ncbi:phycobilisome polypeptide [Cyanobium sp. BA5m-21]|uniref:phycobilisome polypeptide n=1 Tax=Cyanobium sp. BA5m-21 TaxID=2823706 RepID=UPI0020CFAAEC|nr:phycobilisome polypeptide [Cyanobium sp. BA5m-21]MCP9907526.1 phycobilisome polypeptide [Cyanobium sp. BA5m-21]